MDPIDSTTTLTALTLVLIGIFALLTVAAIVWGVREQRRRARADDEIAEDMPVERVSSSGSPDENSPERPEPRPRQNERS